MYIFYQIAAAANHMHQMFVAHRDFKPDNIFLQTGGIVKIGDFGISVLLDTGKDIAPKGTEYYVPPEVWQGEPQSAISDVWALGVLLFEMITHQVPFFGKDSDDTGEKIVRGKPDLKLPRYVSKKMRGLIERMMEPDPKKRPTMLQVMNDPFVKQNERLVLLREKQTDALDTIVLNLYQID